MIYWCLYGLVLAEMLFISKRLGAKGITELINEPGDRIFIEAQVVLAPIWGAAFIYLKDPVISSLMVLTFLFDSAIVLVTFAYSLYPYLKATNTSFLSFLWTELKFKKAVESGRQTLLIRSK